ncbi:MAG: Fe-S cluster assembly protein SufD [Dehalococcoidia bacterium]
MTAIMKQATKGFSRQAVEELSSRRREPSWLRQRRLEAWQVYEATPMPAPQDEAWRRTDISALALDELLPFAEAPYPQVDSMAQLPQELCALLDKGSPEVGLLVQHDSQVVHASLAEEAATQGVVFTSLETAVREQPQLVKRYLMTRCLSPRHGKFSALHGALWSGGAFVYVPQGVEVTLPFRACRWLSGPGLAVFPHTLIVLEAGSKLTFIAEQFSPELDGQALFCGATEVCLHAGAQLRHVSVQQLGRQVYNLAMQRHLLGADSRLDSLIIGLGGKLTKFFVESVLEGPGANAQMRGVVFADADQHFDHHTLQEHTAPDSASDLLFKVVVKDQAMSVHLGTVRVHRGARGTDAAQTVRNLILSEGAKAHPILPLEIEASDVRRCSHAATVGQVDESQLFYLMSRGFSRRDAERLIVDGFFEPILEAIPQLSVQHRLRRAIAEKLDTTTA